MLCPKCKKTNLRTKRTLANGLMVRRERYCTKCKISHWTVELYETDLEKERTQAHSKTVELTSQRLQIETELRTYKNGLRAFKLLIDGAINPGNTTHEREKPEENEENDFCPECGEDISECTC